VTAAAPFGRSGPGLLQRLRPVWIDPVDVRETADVVLPALASPGLRIAVLDRPSGGAVLEVEEGERRLRVRLGDLADDMTRAGVPATADGIAEALVAWVAHRPVTDAAAASGGVAVLDWTDPGHTAIGWTVLVRRGALGLRWAPSAGLPAGTVAGVRSAAAARAAEQDVQLRVEGPVALWSHPLVPGLASAVLAAPDRMRDRVAAAGLPLADMHVVVTPHRPVACASPGVAARLAGQTAEDRVVLSWSELPDLRWL
jgi:hypothetical protein